MDRMTETRIRKQTKPGIFRCDTTLYIRIFPGGSRSFVQKLTLRSGRRIEIGLGGWPLRSLEEARQIAFENRRVVRDGGNPLADKRAATEKTNMPTFRECAENWFDDNRAAWKSGTANGLWTRLDRYILPVVGDRPIGEIDQIAVLDILAPIFRDKHSTGKPLRQAMSSIFLWAVAKTYMTDNPAGSAIAAALPAGSKTKHRAAIEHGDLAEALDAIDDCGASLAARLALKFVALTAVRSAEALGAIWSEIDVASATWVIPSERMKTATEHRVPLSDGAMDVLAQARSLGDGDSALVFPSPRGRAMDSKRLREVVAESGLDAKMTVHGLRSTFRNWCADSGQPRDIAEAALAHSVPGVEGAYFRSDVFDRRRTLMAAWDKYLNSTIDHKVISLRA